MSIRSKKTLCHLTKLENLDNILKYNLISREALIDNGIYFKDVADAEILDGRSLNNLQYYVPFHFYAGNPFDWKVQNNHKNSNFIYICITRELAEYNNFKIIPMHPLSMNPFKIYNYKEGMKEINWNLMETRNYRDPKCKQICMAECITELTIPYEHFQSIAVKDEKTKEIVENKIKKYECINGKKHHNIHIDVRPYWFY